MTSFAELIDYDVQFAELEKHGIFFTEENKKRFKTICDEELKSWGNAGLGTNLGASATNWVYDLFAFIQNLFKGGFDFNNIGDSFSNVTTATGQKTDMHMLNEVGMHIYTRFMHEGGAFVNAAEYVSGQKFVTSANESAPEAMENSIYMQVVNKAHLDVNMPTSLNRKPHALG